MQIGFSFSIWLCTKGNCCWKRELSHRDLGFSDTCHLKLYSWLQRLLRTMKNTRISQCHSELISRNTQISEMQQKVITNQEHIQPQIQHLPQIQPHAAAQDQPDVTRQGGLIQSPPHKHMTLFAGLNSSKIKSLSTLPHFSTCYSFPKSLGKLRDPLPPSHNWKL